MNEKASAAGLTLLLGASLAAFLWWDYRQSADSGRQAAEPLPELREQRVPIPAVPAPKPVPKTPERALYRCDGTTGTTYQPVPCVEGTRQTQASGGTFSIVSPPPPSTVPNRNNRTPAPGVSFISRTPREGEKHIAECAWHERQIAQIDEWARQRSTAQRQERLKEERRKHKNAMWSLKCGL